MNAKGRSWISIKLNQAGRKLKKEFSENLLSPVSKSYYKAKYRCYADPDEIITIDINDIYGWYMISRYREITFQGQIRGGDWSSKIKLKQDLLNGSDKYISIRQRYEDGVPWRETNIFTKRYSQFLKKGIAVKGCTEILDLEKYYEEYYDKLFLSLERYGVISAKDEVKEVDPIFINIDEKGRLLYTGDGNHRLFMCYVLGIEKMPVQVWIRHKKWQDIREVVLTTQKSELDEFHLKFLEHPDIYVELSES
jgi:hypothetical protein